MCPPLSSLGLIIVTRSSQAALNIFLKNFKRSETQLQYSSSKLINEIMFHPSSEIFTGCPSTHVPSIICKHCHSFFSDTALLYLSDLLRVYSPSRQLRSSSDSPQWGAADAEIKVPFGENTELKRSPFIAWSRSVYSHTCYAYCQGFLSCLFLPFQSIHLHFFQNLSQFFPVLACRIK